MNPDKTLARLRAQPDDVTELERAARSVGHEVVRRRPQILGRFRAGLAQLVPRGEFSRGFISAMREFLAALATELDEHDDDLVQEAATVVRERDWAEALRAIHEGSDRSSTLADALGVSASRATRLLTALRAVRLVECYVRPHGDGRTRPNRLTPLGRAALSLIAPSPSRVDDEQVKALASLTLRMKEDLMVHSCVHLPSFTRAQASEPWPLAEPLEHHIQSIADVLCDQPWVKRHAQYIYATEDSTRRSVPVVDLDTLHDLVAERYPRGNVCVLVRGDPSTYHRWRGLELDAQEKETSFVLRLIDRVDLGDIDDITKTTEKEKSLVLYDSFETLESDQGMLEAHGIRPSLLDDRGPNIQMLSSPRHDRAVAG